MTEWHVPIAFFNPT